ncbi:type II secretion system protein [Cellulomonas endophytica]|uniref:type II secretion system protein n=1 Tax=Cellulomonas endophytica TaxID=2494735 RepID=UPI0013E98C29|nr:type II secretion system protein [Cellulomonas endophytica]
MLQLQNRARSLREARENGESGFTLIELLIVIVVLGILASIVVFGVGTFRADATKRACESNLKTVNVAQSAYIASNATPALSTTDTGVAMGQLKTAKYIEEVPTFTGTVTFDATSGKFTTTC